jgi:hypothetical protein
MWCIRIASLGLVVGAAGCTGRFNEDVWHGFTAWSIATAIGSTISESSWLFAIIESFHLTGLALLGGAAIVVDFALLGLGLRNESLPRLSESAQPWLMVGLIITLISGPLLFLSEATKFYSPNVWDSAEAPFVVKMFFLALAITFTFTVRRRVLRSAANANSDFVRRIVGTTSLVLWLAVAVGGRAIGFY